MTQRPSSRRYPSPLCRCRSIAAMVAGGYHNCAFHCAISWHRLAQPDPICLLLKGNPEFSYAPWQNLYFFPLPHQQRSLRPILRGDPGPLARSGGRPRAVGPPCALGRALHDVGDPRAGSIPATPGMASGGRTGAPTRTGLTPAGWDAARGSGTAAGAGTRAGAGTGPPPFTVARARDPLAAAAAGRAGGAAEPASPALPGRRRQHQPSGGLPLPARAGLVGTRRG